jgi:hypothetical protein
VKEALELEVKKGQAPKLNLPEELVHFTVRTCLSQEQEDVAKLGEAYPEAHDYMYEVTYRALSAGCFFDDLLEAGRTRTAAKE